MWTRSIVNIPDGVGLALAISNGAAFIGKGIQTFAERPQMNTTTQTSVRTSSKTTEIDEQKVDV